MSAGDIDFSNTERPVGIRRFAVRFDPPRPDQSTPPAANDQGLVGSGWVEVRPDEVVFAEVRAGEFNVHRTRVFALGDVANVEWSPEAGVIIVRTRNDTRHVTVWLQRQEETAALKDLLPSYVAPDFIANRRHELDFAQRLQDVAPRAPVVPVLIGLNVLMFAVLVIAGGGLLESNPLVHVKLGSNYGALTWNGEPWRLLTSAFLHFGLIHIAFNMYALYNGGVLTERLFGSSRFLLIYLLSAVAGSVVSGWWDPTRNSAGASGAVFGVYGALLAFFAMRRDDIPASLLKSAGKGALLLCFYSLAMGAVNPMIDNACHVGGLLGGLLSGCLLARPFRVEERRKPQPARVALIAAGFGVVLALASMSLWLPGGSRRTEIVAVGAIQDFSVEETKLVERYASLAKSLETGALDVAAAADQIEKKVLLPWRNSARPLLALDAGRIRDPKFADRLRKLQHYLNLRAEAMVLTVAALRGETTHSREELEEIWQQVQKMVNDLNPAK